MTMKKKLLLLMGIFSLGILNAQIGINTDQLASGVLVDIDPLGNNASSSLTKFDDDIVIDNNGNVGIGTTTPASKLHIVSNSTPAFRLVDGSQGDKKLLMCKDATGTAQWGEAVFNNFGTIPFAHNSLTGTQVQAQGVAFYSGLSYTFSKPGVYSVSIVVKCTVNRPNASGVFTWAQILPTSNNIGTVWNASSPRFGGAYEVFVLGNKFIVTPTSTISYFAFNQTITITNTNNTIYLCFTGAWPLPADVINISWGVSSTNPAPNGDSRNETTGSFIKIN